MNDENSRGPQVAVKGTGDNPYQVSPGAQVARANELVPSRRSPTEWIVLVSLAGFPVFLAIVTVLGNWTLNGPHLALGVLLFIAFAIAGLVALWLLWRGRREGAFASVVFYGIQVISTDQWWSFNSLPAIRFALNPHSGVVFDLNIVALILFILSVRVWREHVVAEDSDRN
jgi:hypothetical protein